MGSPAVGSEQGQREEGLFSGSLAGVWGGQMKGKIKVPCEGHLCQALERESVFLLICLLSLCLHD